MWYWVFVGLDLMGILVYDQQEQGKKLSTSTDEREWVS
jgi:hypothetical protein